MPILESDRVLGTQHEALTASQWRLIILASLGGALEFYNFVVYGVSLRADRAGQVTQR